MGVRYLDCMGSGKVIMCVQSSQGNLPYKHFRTMFFGLKAVDYCSIKLLIFKHRYNFKYFLFVFLFNPFVADLFLKLVIIVEIKIKSILKSSGKYSVLHLWHIQLLKRTHLTFKKIKLAALYGVV